MSRKYKYIDINRVNERAEEMMEEGDDDGAEPHDVLYETLLDLIQVAEDNGIEEDEIDAALRRVSDYRAKNVRSRFRLHTPE